MARLLLIVLLVMAPLAATGQPAPGPPPGPPAPIVAVPRHLRAVSERLSDATADDEVGRRALAEARTSLAGAESALAAKALRTADELAASADDLIHAADGPPRNKPQPDPAETLARIDVAESVLAGVTERRVRELIEFARSVADGARRKTALSQAGAGREAARAEAIARAAAHVAIARDPSLGPALPGPPRPPGRPGPPPPADSRAEPNR